MAILEIKIYGDGSLRKQAAPVKEITDEIRQLVKDMAETMFSRQGVGLAAPQVGISQRIIVFMYARSYRCLINPEVVRRRGRQKGEEGCLSLPEIVIKIARADEIRVKGLDVDGKEVVLDADGMLSRVIQHELDHLRGTMILDYANVVRKAFLSWKFARRKKGR